MKITSWTLLILACLGLGCKSKEEFRPPTPRLMLNTVSLQALTPGDTSVFSLHQGYFRGYGSFEAAKNRGPEPPLFSIRIDQSWEGFYLDDIGSGTYWFVADRAYVEDERLLALSWSEPVPLYHEVIPAVAQQHRLFLPLQRITADTFLVQEITFSCPDCLAFPPYNFSLEVWLHQGPDYASDLELVYAQQYERNNLPATLADLKIPITFTGYVPGARWGEVVVRYSGNSLKRFPLDFSVALTPHHTDFPAQINFYNHENAEATLTLDGSWHYLDTD